MKAQREKEAQDMSMEDWDFAYYGKGLDGYVHFRQGIKEIESHEIGRASCRERV